VTRIRDFQEQEAIYHLLLNLQTDLLSKMKDGVVIREVYQHAISFIKKQKPELEKHFVKNIGFGVRFPHIFVQRQD
jgi:nucleosome binding factor SPN SPT16 subunit